MDVIYFANKGVNHQHQKTRRGIPRDSPRPVSNLPGPLLRKNLRNLRSGIMATTVACRCFPSAKRRSPFLPGKCYRLELGYVMSFIDSWITPYFVKPFMTTSRFFFACFVTYKKGNVWQLKDDSCLKQSSPYFTPCQVEMETQTFSLYDLSDGVSC